MSSDVQKALHFLTTQEAEDPDALLAMCLHLGEVNVRVLAMLDSAHSSECVLIN